MAKTFVRKPLGKREAHIIKRMKVVGGLLVTKIAEIVGRHKKTLYTVFSGKAFFAKRGPKNKLTAHSGFSQASRAHSNTCLPVSAVKSCTSPPCSLSANTRAKVSRYTLLL